MWYGSLKEGNGYHNTCQSSSLCKVRLLTECQWPYVLASLACQWSGCWLAGWTLGCDAGCSGASSRQCCVTTGVAWSETLRAGHWPLGPHKTWVWPNISAVLWWITNLPWSEVIMSDELFFLNSTLQDSALRRFNIVWENFTHRVIVSSLKEGNYKSINPYQYQHNT